VCVLVFGQKEEIGLTWRRYGQKIWIGPLAKKLSGWFKAFSF
jgi:hypothetical protein